jgi:hypothetical protein
VSDGDGYITRGLRPRGKGSFGVCDWVSCALCCTVMELEMYVYGGMDMSARAHLILVLRSSQQVLGVRFHGSVL